MLKKIAIKEGLPRAEKFAKGWVEVYKKLKNDNLFKLHAKSNLIVYGGREWILPRILDEDNTNLGNPGHKDYAIYWMSFGEGGAPSGDPLNPTPPTDSDSSLVSELTIGATGSPYADSGKKHPIDSITYQQDSSNANRYLIVQLGVTLDETEANGGGSQNINEAGLWIADSDQDDGQASPASIFILFARTTFPTIVKDANLALQIFWYIYS